MITRREILAAGVAAPLLWAGATRASAQGATFRPEEFGARGDGRTDDTEALQRCLDAAPAGAVVALRKGAVYRVDTNWRPTWSQFGGLRLKSGQVLQLNGGELRALPSRAVRGSVVQGFRTSGWKIVGPGRIVGERIGHLGAGGEWGMGVSAWSAADWQIVGGVEIADCWGDGLYIGTTEGRDPCDRFLVDSVRIRNCRRNGISITSGRNGEIRNCTIEKIDGTAPAGGIDLEADSVAKPNRNIRISGTRIRDVEVGIYLSGGSHGIAITGNDIEARNSGIIFGDHAVDVAIEGNPNIRSLKGGAEGGAIRTIVSRHDTIRNVRIRDNQLSGGGFFVLAVEGPGAQGLAIDGNRISATNPGTQGIAMINNAQFTNNICVIGPRAGKANDYFILLKAVSHGGNSYANQSPHKMHSALFGGRDIGSDRYQGPSLRRAWEPL